MPTYFILEEQQWYQVISRTEHKAVCIKARTHRRYSRDRKFFITIPITFTRHNRRTRTRTLRPSWGDDTSPLHYQDRINTIHRAWDIYKNHIELKPESEYLSGREGDITRLFMESSHDFDNHSEFSIGSLSLAISLNQSVFQWKPLSSHYSE